MALFRLIFRILPLVGVLGQGPVANNASDGDDAPAVSQETSDRIAAVVATLQDILESVESDERRENQIFGQFLTWCAQEENLTADALDEAKLQIGESQASVQELSATVTQLEQVLSDSGVEREQARDTIAKATAVREKDAGQHEEDMQLNSQSINEITEAVRILGEYHGQASAAGFLQVAKRSKHTRRGGAPGESSVVFGIIKGLKDKLEETRRNLLADESQQVTQHTSFLNTEGLRVSGLTDTIAVKSQEHTNARVELVEAQQITERLEVQIKELTDILGEVLRQCEDKKQWRAVRSRDRQQEKAALTEAIAFIQQAVPPRQVYTPSLVQIRAHANGEAPMALLQAHRRVRRVANQHHSLHHALLGAANAQLAALAVSSGANADGRKGALESAKTVVKQLIGVLQKDQEDETAKKKYCQAELIKKGGEEGALSAEIERLNSSIERQTTEADVLTDEVSIIERELEEMQVRLTNATSIRKTEKEVYEAGTRDRTLAVKVLQQAKQVMRQFYATADKTALLQANQNPPPMSTTGSSRKELPSKAVMDRLDMVVDDIEKEQRDADKQEKSAVAEFLQLQRLSRDEFDEQMQAITERKKIKAKTLVHLGADKEAHTQKLQDHAAVMEQLTALHGDCDDLLRFYDQRLKDRSFEVSQLRDVVDILSGSSIAARTGLLEKGSKPAEPLSNNSSDDAMDERELALLRDLSNTAGTIATQKPS